MAETTDSQIDHDQNTSLLTQDNNNNQTHTNESQFRVKLIKYSALSCVLLLSFGSHYAAHTIGTLKAILKQNLKITNTQYGSLQSSVSLVNTIIPIFGGAFVDYFGTNYGSLFATSMIALGSVVVALSSNLESFSLMVLGRVLYGVGSGTIVTVQETIIAYWFQGKNLGTSMGLKLAVSRLGSFLAIVTVIPISNYFGFYGYSLWFAAIVCFLSLLTNIVYIFLAGKLANGDKPKSKKMLQVSHLLEYPAMLWLFILAGFVLSGSWTSFMYINVELIKLNFDKSDESAAYIASISQIAPFFIPPLLGWFIDKKGKRPAVAIATAVAFTQAMLYLGFTDLSPIIGMVLFSLAMSMGPVIMTSCIPMLLPVQKLGTALGMYKSAMNVGTSILNVVLGKLQDYGKDYYYCMVFLTMCGVVGIIITFAIEIIDKRQYNGLLASPSSDRENGEELLLKQPKLYSYVSLSIAGALLVTSWVLYVSGLS